MLVWSGVLLGVLLHVQGFGIQQFLLVLTDYLCGDGGGEGGGCVLLLLHRPIWEGAYLVSSPVIMLPFGAISFTCLTWRAFCLL